MTEDRPAGRPRPAKGGASEPPWHLRGNYAPVIDESTVTELEVVGEIPPQLQGRYLRNGPNPRNGLSGHWFFGNGMLHGVALRDGRALWYRNRYVRTGRFADPDAQLVGADGSVDRVHSSAANTNVVRHAQRILALEEAHVPWEVDPQLETVGPVDFGGRLTTAFTAHPKMCPDTGEMLAFGYAFMPPYLTYHRVSADGELVQSVEVPVPGPTMMHDFNITRNHVIFMDLPVVFDLALASRATMPYRWDDEYGARLGVMARDGGQAAPEVTWFDIEPSYVFHPVNAYERAGGDEIVIDVARYPSLWRGGSNDFDGLALLHRWVIDRPGGRVTEEPLDDRPAEFGRVADRVVGHQYRYGYLLATRAGEGELGLSNELLKYDLHAGTKESHDFGKGRHPGEAVFAANPAAPTNAAEDDGWCLTIVHDQGTDCGELAILDAADFSARPVATIKLPTRVPYGFHGNWMADA